MVEVYKQLSSVSQTTGGNYAEFPLTSFTTYGSTTQVSGWKGLKIVNGTGKCTFKAEKDGIVFMKWSWASATSTDGGGVLSPAKSVVIEHESQK